MFRFQALVSMTAFIASGAALAQQPQFPSLVRMVVPFAAGGSTDVLARTVSSQLGPRLGSNVVVDNRLGAGGLIGAAAVSKAPRDGSMLLFSTGSLATAVATSRNIQFNLDADLLPVALLGEGPMVVAVSTRTEIRTPADLVAQARARPGALTYGTAGIGTIGHLAAELIDDGAKVQTKHIPYKGTAQALTDLASGTIDWTVAIYTTLAPQISAGRVRIIGVTSRQPNPSFNGVLPIASAVPGYHATTWTAVFAPPATPAPVIQRLNRELNEIAKSKEVNDQLVADGVIARPLTPQEVGTLVRDSVNTWKSIATAKNIVVDF